MDAERRNLARRDDAAVMSGSGRRGVDALVGRTVRSMGAREPLDAEELVRENENLRDQR
jgi:hypothetical protein